MKYSPLVSLASKYSVHPSRKVGHVIPVLKFIAVLLAMLSMTGNVWAAKGGGGNNTPVAPSALTATAISSTQIQLAWRDNSSNESGFKIERAPTSSGPWQQVGTAGANVTSYNANGLAPVTTYYFRVRAYTSRGNSSYTPVASATTQSASVPCTYTVASSSTPLGGGTTSGGGTVNCNSSVTMNASPSAGYNFASWTEAGTVVSTSASYTFTATSSRSLVANFTAIPCTYTISASSSVGGTATGGGTVNCGSTVTVGATPNSGYNFVNWTDNGIVVSTSASYSFAANANRALVANFAAIPCNYAIITSSSPSAGGTSFGGGTVTCGSSVTVSASANSSYSFANWTENGVVVGASASYTFTATANRTLVANFTAVPCTYNIAASASPSAGGTAVGGGSVTCGSSVTLSATPSACYSFVNWTENGAVVSTSASYTFAANASRSLVANFAPVSYTISASVSTAGGGSASGPGTIACGTSAIVTATPASCYRFVNWTENGAVVSASATYSFTANASRNLVANFAPITYTISASSSSAGGSVSGGGSVNCGASVTVSATAASCYAFVSWTENGTVVSTSANYIFAANASRTLVANFAPITYMIGASSAPSAGGTSFGGGTVNCGLSVTVSASANSGYSFANWTENGVVVGASASYTFTATANRTLVANFTAVPCTYNIAASASPSAGGTAVGGGSVTCGSSVTLSATPSACYSFVNWTENGAVVSTSASYTFAANASRNLVANFAPITFTISASSSSAGGSVSGGGTVNCGASVTVAASANTGYNFVNWTENGTVVSSSANYVFAANRSRNLVANFSQIPCTYSLTSAGANFGAASGSGNVTINASAGTCPWTASTLYNWIHTSSSGNGSGTASYTVDANASLSQRSGTLTIGGQTFTVTQSGHSVPVANAGANQTTSVGNVLSFNGSGSSARDGAAITTYSWAFGDSSSASGVSVAHAYSAAGTFVVTLTVSDSFGASGSATATVTVTNAAPPLSVTLTSPTAGSAISNTVSLGASASSTATRVEFYCDNLTTPLGSATAAPFSFACDTTLMPNGSHNLYCKAFDASGNSATSPNVTVMVSNLAVPSGSWTKRLGGIGNDNASAVAVDASGNILLAGYFKFTADFGGTPLTSAGGADLVLAKYNSAGVHQWSYRFGGTGDETVKAIALDASGNIFVAGYFTGSANFGGTTFTSAGQYNAFIAKYSASGQHLWSKSFGSTTSTTYIDLFNGLAVDSQGNVVVTGTFQGDASFGGAALHSLWGTAVNIVLAKYSTDGTHLWSKTFASGNENYANGIAIDRNDNILLTGSFYSTINFASNDGLDNTIMTAYPTYQNIFVAKFTRDGVHVWSKRYGGTNGDKGISITADSNGDVILGGMFYKRTDLGNGTIILGGAVDLDSFVAKYSGADGTYRWAVPIVGNNGCWVNAVKTDTQNNVVLTGFFYGTFAFGGQSLTSTLNSYDGYVAKYNSSGGLTWANGFGGAGSDGSSALAIAGTNPVLAGAFNGTAVIGGATLVSAGMGDAFLMRLNP